MKCALRFSFSLIGFQVHVVAHFLFWSQLFPVLQYLISSYIDTIQYCCLHTINVIHDLSNTIRHFVILLLLYEYIINRHCIIQWDHKDSLQFQKVQIKQRYSLKILITSKCIDQGCRQGIYNHLIFVFSAIIHKI